MPSEISDFARELLRTDSLKIDKVLQEVRECLALLKTKNGCWCNPMVSASLATLHHSATCQRTRALYARLRVDGGKESDATDRFRRR